MQEGEGLHQGVAGAQWLPLLHVAQAELAEALAEGPSDHRLTEADDEDRLLDEAVQRLKRPLQQRTVEDGKQRLGAINRQRMRACRSARGQDDGLMEIVHRAPPDVLSRV